MDEGGERPKVPVTLSRRNFLRATAVALGAAVVDCATSPLGIKPGAQENKPSKEKETELKPTVIILDIFGPDKAKESFPPGFSEQEKLAEMGIDDPTTKVGLLKGVPQNEEQTKLLILKILENQRKNHGQQVVDVMKKAEQFLTQEQETTPAQVSIAEVIQIDGLEYDELGNPILHYQINPNAIDRMVSGSSESIVNMSFEPGYNNIKYEMFDYPKRNRPMKQEGVVIRDSNGNILSKGQEEYLDHSGKHISEEEYNRLQIEANNAKPVLLSPRDRDVDYVDGYFGDHAASNIKILAGIARNHPNKFFVATGGNPTGMHEIPDIRTGRASIESEGLWPNNLLVVGYEEEIPGVFIGPASYGADLYISVKDLMTLGFSGASSYATPVVTEIIRELIVKGQRNHQQIKSSLMEIAETKECFFNGAEKGEYRVLGLEKAKQNL